MHVRKIFVTCKPTQVWLDTLVPPIMSSKAKDNKQIPTWPRWWREPMSKRLFSASLKRQPFLQKPSCERKYLTNMNHRLLSVQTIVPQICLSYRERIWPAQTWQTSIPGSDRRKGRSSLWTAKGQDIDCPFNVFCLRRFFSKNMAFKGGLFFQGWRTRKIISTNVELFVVNQPHMPPAY